MNKNIAWAIVVALVIIGVVVLLAPKKDKYEISTFKQQYLSGCVSESSNYPYCNCTYDKMEAKLGEKGIVSMSLEYSQTKVLSSEALDAAGDCMYLYK